MSRVVKGSLKDGTGNSRSLVVRVDLPGHGPRPGTAAAFEQDRESAEERSPTEQLGVANRGRS
jgi:hypothetical protein